MVTINNGVNSDQPTGDRRPSMTREEMAGRIADLDAKIAAYPHWGAALAAMDEERRGLKRALAAS